MCIFTYYTVICLQSDGKFTCYLQDNNDSVLCILVPCAALADSLWWQLPLPQDLVCPAAVWSEKTAGEYPQGKACVDVQPGKACVHVQTRKVCVLVHLGKAFVHIQTGKAYVHAQKK